ncbi:MAG: CBS domain-containing protein [Planctomycetota bacterium]
MFVRLWMTQRVETVGPGDALHEARQRMEAGDFRCLPVVENECLVGLLTQGDVERLGAARAGDRVRDHMLTDLITTDPYQPLEVAAALMREHKIGALPVVHRERLVGILTQTDILDAVIKFMSGRNRGVARVTFDMKADFEHLHQAMDLLQSHDLVTLLLTQVTWSTRLHRSPLLVRTQPR